MILISEDEKNIQEVVGQVKSTKEQLNELAVDKKSILDADIDYDLSKWKKRESEIVSAIDKMGPINLAAIDQFKEYEERKSYLTMQKEDLLSALNSLEDAIKKIDKDTKERFKDTFEKVINDSKTPVIVDFWAEWCGPCKMIAPILDEVSVELKDKILVTKVNLDENQDLALKYSIRSIPSLLLFEGGSLLDMKVGMLSKTDLLSWIESKVSK